MFSAPYGVLTADCPKVGRFMIQNEILSTICCDNSFRNRTVQIEEILIITPQCLPLIPRQADRCSMQRLGVVSNPE